MSKGRGKTRACLYFFHGIINYLGNKRIIDNVPDDLEGRQRGNATLKQAAERPSKSCHGHFHVNGPNNRCTKLDFIPYMIASWSFYQLFYQYGTTTQDKQDKPPEGLEKIAYSNQHQRRKGECLMHITENLGDIGDDKSNKEEKDYASNKKHKNRVGQGCLEATSQGILVFTEFRQTIQNQIKRARGFTSPYHVDVDL